MLDKKHLDIENMNINTCVNETCCGALRNTQNLGLQGPSEDEVQCNRVAVSMGEIRGRVLMGEGHETDTCLQLPKDSVRHH